MFWFLLIAIIAFGAYSIATQYANTDPTQSVSKRVWTSATLAAAALGALVMGYLKGGVTP